jgi:hypothetical protein
MIKVQICLAFKSTEWSRSCPLPGTPPDAYSLGPKRLQPPYVKKMLGGGNKARFVASAPPGAFLSSPVWSRNKQKGALECEERNGDQRGVQVRCLLAGKEAMGLATFVYPHLKHLLQNDMEP